jgi:hypothetical protein
MPKKTISKKAYIAITLLVIIAIAGAAIVYASMISNSGASVTVGVHTGDTFSYKLTGTAVLFDSAATPPPGFSDFNNTDYYKVAITGINGSVVSFDTVWQFKNGTEIKESQLLDLSTGRNTGDFWAIYTANLNVNDLLRPKGADGLVVNSTDTKTYANSTRQRNHFDIGNVFYDVNDPTYSTQRYEYDQVYFDKQTGVLETLTNVQVYNNPQMNLIITWQLNSSTVWNV